MEGKVYIGDLKDATEKELDREFGVYGPLKSVWVARNPSGFAFVEFEDPRDADDAIRALDGKRMCGGRVRVEAATGRSRSRPKPWARPTESYSRGPPPPPGRRPFHPEDKCYECGRRGHYAYDCPQYAGGRRDSYRSRNSRSRSRSPVRRSYSRSRSRSPKRRRRTKSNTPSRSRSPSPKRRSRSGSRDASDRRSEDK